MAIIQALCDSFRQEILEGVHNLNSDTIKMALYSPSAGLSNLTTSYTPTGEIVSTGYTAGGQTLVPLNGTAVYGQVGLAYVQFQNPSWTLTTPGAGARGALWYNASKGNKAILVLDFGTMQYPNNTNNIFTVNFGPYPSLFSPLRLA